VLQDAPEVNNGRRKGPKVLSWLPVYPPQGSNDIVGNDWYPALQ